MTSGSESPDLKELTVRDLMEPHVITVSPDMPVSDLVELLREEGVGGVPVVDRDEVCVGVVSATDVNRAAHREERGRAEPAAEEAGSGAGESDEAGAFYRLPDGLTAGPPLAAAVSGLPTTRLGARAVREIMTPATFSVRPDATLPELARFLVGTGIHRALVFEDRRLTGLVTTMDVVRAVAELDSDL